MATMACPHCGGENVEGGSFCEKCGKALPTAMPAGPQVVTGAAMASTAAGQTVQVEHLRKKARRAANILLVVGILTLAFAFVLIAMISGKGALPETAIVELAITIGLGIVFIALAVWAYSDPLPPSIVGLVLYGSLKAFQFLVIIANLNSGSAQQQAVAASQLGGMVIAVIFIIILASGVVAGLQHRRLKAQMQRQSMAPAAPGA